MMVVGDTGIEPLLLHTGVDRPVRTRRVASADDSLNEISPGSLSPVPRSLAVGLLVLVGGPSASACGRAGLLHP